MALGTVRATWSPVTQFIRQITGGTETVDLPDGTVVNYDVFDNWNHQTTPIDVAGSASPTTDIVGGTLSGGTVTGGDLPDYFSPVGPGSVPTSFIVRVRAKSDGYNNSDQSPEASVGLNLPPRFADEYTPEIPAVSFSKDIFRSGSMEDTGNVALGMDVVAWDERPHPTNLTLAIAAPTTPANAPAIQQVRSLVGNNDESGHQSIQLTIVRPTGGWPGSGTETVTYVYDLTLTDEYGETSAAATLTVNIRSTPNAAPVITPDQTFSLVNRTGSLTADLTAAMSPLVQDTDGSIASITIDGASTDPSNPGLYLAGDETEANSLNVKLEAAAGATLTDMLVVTVTGSPGVGTYPFDVIARDDASPAAETTSSGWEVELTAITDRLATPTGLTLRYF